jgi:hypothetical protein
MSYEAFSCRWCGEWSQGEMESARCTHCGKKWRSRDAGVHSSEKTIVYLNPQTGERRTPARADQPMPEVYRRQGFERVEISSMTSFERETGLVHEASTFGTSTADSGFDPVPIRRPIPTELVKELADDLRAAAASGPWTESENSPADFSIPAPL